MTDHNAMDPILIEPTDTFFFRDSIPMSAGQGRGAGARMPLPGTLHEAFRASLLEKHGRTGHGLSAFRPREAPRSGGWSGQARTVMSLGSKDFQSLQIAGPLPFLSQDSGGENGILFPLPMDLVFGADGKAHTMKVLTVEGFSSSARLPCVATSPVPPSKKQPFGFVSASCMRDYLSGELTRISADRIVKLGELFLEEYRIGISMDADRNATENGGIYAATHARPSQRFRFAAWAGLKRPVAGEAEKLESLDFLLLGGERRIARVWRENVAIDPPSCPTLPDQATGPTLLKWTLATPAVFASGIVPGWCRDTRPGAKKRPDGDVCLPMDKGRARLIGACTGKPLAFAGWDTVTGKSKPTRLASPAGSVFWFLCDSPAAAAELASLLHWRPRSDFFGEKGFGYGLCSFATTFHPTSRDVQALASSSFDL